MTTRAMGPLAGIGWLKNAINLGRHNPKAIFGGAGLLMVVMMVLMVPLVLLQALAQTQIDLTGFPAMALSLLPMLAILVLSAIFMVGYLRLLDAAANHRPVGATDIFAGFRDGAASLRALGLVLLLTVLQYVVLLALLGVFAPGFISAYLELLQTGAVAAPQPDAELLENLWILFALIIPLSLFSYAVQAVGLGQVALRGRSVYGALVDGIAGAAKNAIPLLLFLVFAVVAGLVLGLLIALVAMLLAFVAGLVGTWLQVTLLVLAVPVYIALMVVLYALMFAVMYQLWRDVCGGSGVGQVPAEALTA